MNPIPHGTQSGLAKPAIKVGSRTRVAAVLADKLRADLKEGRYQAGERFPSMREIATQTKMTYSSVLRAVEILQSEGLVEKHNGSKGTYVTSGPASAQASGAGASTASKAKRIGVVMPFWASSTSHYVVGDILMGITGQANEEQCRVELIHNSGDEAMAFDYVDKVMSLDLDGVIWVQPAPNYELNIARLIDRGVNVVTTGRRFSRLPMTTVHEDVRQTGELVAEHLVKRNGKELVVLSGPSTDAFSTDRIDAIRQSLESRGLELPEKNICIAHNYAMDKSEPGQRALEASVRSFVTEHKGFDAVFVLHTNHLGPLVKLHETGQRKCPEDFSLIHLAPACEPVRQIYPQIPITLIQWPLVNMGRAAVRKLEELWGNPSETESPDLSPTVDEAN
jgi:DNA-binding LacI/PurR family transcriptional regulator